MLLLAAGVAEAKPPSFAKAKKVAAAWLAAARKGRVPARTSGKIVIDVEGHMRRDQLAVAVRCIRDALQGTNQDRWLDAQSVGDEHWVSLSLLRVLTRTVFSTCKRPKLPISIEV